MKSLGASYAFDHRDADVVDQILKVMKPGDVVFDCIGDAVAQKPCAQILSKLGGGKLADVLWPLENEYGNVEVVTVNALDPGLVDIDIADAVWRQYIPYALAAGKFQAKPDPMIIEGGLERVQEGIDILRKGVSAKKVVIEVSKTA